MGSKLLRTGLTLISCSQILVNVPQTTVVGEVIMVIGCILMWLDK